jgi:hypothetical protein
MKRKEERKNKISELKTKQDANQKPTDSKNSTIEKTAPKVKEEQAP